MGDTILGILVSLIILAALNVLDINVNIQSHVEGGQSSFHFGAVGTHGK